MKNWLIFSQQIVNPNLPDVSSGGSTMKNILTFLFGLIALLSVLVIVLSGMRIIYSGGNPEKVAKARNWIIYAVVGLVISLSATVIVSFVLNKSR